MTHLAAGRAGIESELCWAIRNRLEEVLKNLILETDNPDVAPPRPPRIINGYLPPKRESGDSEMPVVIVRPSKGRTGDNGFSRVTVNLIVVVHSEEFDGYEYALQVLHRVKMGFMQQPVLDNRYRFEFPFEWELIDEQPYPNWQIKVKTEWAVPTPQLIPDEGVL